MTLSGTQWHLVELSGATWSTLRAPQLGNLRLDLLPALVLGSAAGSALASRTAAAADEGALRIVFAAYAALLGVSYLRQGAALRSAVRAAAAGGGGAASRVGEQRAQARRRGK